MVKLFVLLALALAGWLAFADVAEAARCRGGGRGKHSGRVLHRGGGAEHSGGGHAIASGCSGGVCH